MQTPKARTASLEVPQKSFPATLHAARKMRTGGSDSDSFSSPNPSIKTPKDKSPKVAGRSPRSPMTEKKRPGRVSELETQLANLQEELKKAKDQLSSSESWKKRAQQEAEAAKEELATMTEKLHETQRQLIELSESEEARVKELRKISQDRDRVWQSELEAVQKQHDLDSAALSSALHEIQKLKIQLERFAESEAAQARNAEAAYTEIQSLRIELTETLALVERLKIEMADSRKSETLALEELNKAQMQLEVAKLTEETLRSDSQKAMEAYKFSALELDQSRDRVNSLEELVGKLRTDLSNSGKTSGDHSCNLPNLEENMEDMGSNDLTSLKLEVSEFRAALETAEKRYQEEYIQGTLQIRSAYELVERTKTESLNREADLEAKLKAAQVDIEQLKAKLMEKEHQFEKMSAKNSELIQQFENYQLTEKRNNLIAELDESESTLEELKASLLDKENKLQSITEENEMLKLEIGRKEAESTKANDEALALAEAAKASEKEALLKLGYLTEEADKNTKRAARVIEQLDAAQAANSEMEAELRRLKVQSDQWRKAAEAAASMLSTGGNNGKCVERTGSMDYHTLGGKLSSPYYDDMEDESPKKRNGNMLKKISVLLKKGQK